MIGYSTVTQKGQITIPANIRRELGLKKNQRVMIIKDADGAKIQAADDLLSLKGSITPRSRPENFKAMRRAFSRHLGTRKHHDIDRSS